MHRCRAETGIGCNAFSSAIIRKIASSVKSAGLYRTFGGGKAASGRGLTPGQIYPFVMGLFEGKLRLPGFFC